jgi:hypothetical protein
MEVPDIGMCIRIPLDERHQNELVQGSNRTMLLLTPYTLVTLVKNTVSLWQRYGDPTSIRWFQESETKAKAILVRKEKMPTYSPVRIEVSRSTDMQTTRFWNGMVVDIKAVCVINCAMSSLCTVNHVLYASDEHFGQPYVDDLNHLIQSVQAAA